jgi:hypothetical protein
VLDRHGAVHRKGGTTTVSAAKSGTITFEVSGSGAFSAGAILAKAKTTISVKVADSVSVFPGHTYSQNVPGKKYGHMQYGSWGYKASWKRYRTATGNGCGGVEIPCAERLGAGNWPVREEGYRAGSGDPCC